MEPIYTYLVKWNKSTDSFAKLQAAYGVLAVLLFFIAAIVSLIDQRVGYSVLFFAFVSALVFVGNGVIWSLIRTFVLPHIEKRAPASTRKK